MAPIYFDMLVEWHDKLTPDQQETLRHARRRDRQRAPGRGRGHRRIAAAGAAVSALETAMPWTRDDLRRTQEHIDQALHYISMQEQRISELQQEGRDTANAEELLSALRQTLILLVRHKTVIERDLK